MGRAKLELKRIEKTTNRQITFSKRKKGLIKKAYELSTLCDIDLALLMFSPSDRLCLFSGQTSVEDVLARYINLPDQERENAIVFPDQRKRHDRSLDMGRAKLELKRIEKTTNRQITFSKRKKGLIKKAYELSTLCDIDLALLMFSPSDRLCLFSGQTSVEDVLARYINLPDQERENAIVFPDQRKRQGSQKTQNKECLLRTLEQLKIENDMALHINESRPINSDVEKLEQEVCRLQQQLQMSEEELRKFEPDPVRFTSMEDIEACEAHLINTLTRVVQRREHLLNKSCEAPAPSTQQSRERVIVNNWGSEAEPK